MKTITCPNCNLLINIQARKKELQAVSATKQDIHMLVASSYDVQHMRIIFENRFRATNNNQYAIYADRLFTIEQGMKDDIQKQTEQYPIHKWIIANKGLSYDIAGQLIGVIQDIKRFDNISKLWAYFGLAVIDVCQDCKKRWYAPNDKPKKILHIATRLMEQYEKKIVKEGKADFAKDASGMLCSCTNPHLKKTTQRLISGSLIDYNPKAKMLAYKIGVQFVKQGDLYRKLYDQFKAEYAAREDLKTEISGKAGKKVKAKNGEVTESKGTAHIHNMAQRKAVKIFLQHLWLEWRKEEGLSVSMPYVIDIMKHSKYIASNVIKGEDNEFYIDEHL